MDISTISAGLSSIKTAIDITKGLSGLNLSLKDAEVKLKIAELLESLSEAKTKLVEAREENEALKDKISELEQTLNLKSEVIFKDGFYFTKESKNGEPEGPFCPKCYRDEEKLIPVQELPKGMQDFGKYECPKCGNISNKQ